MAYVPSPNLLSASLVSFNLPSSSIWENQLTFDILSSHIIVELFGKFTIRTVNGDCRSYWPGDILSNGCSQPKSSVGR